MSKLSFFLLVRKMRQMQHTYYTERTRTALQQSIQLEKRVDSEIRKGETYLKEHPELFPNADQLLTAADPFACPYDDPSYDPNPATPTEPDLFPPQ